MPLCKTDIVGPYSGIIYATAGTEVTKIHENGNMALVQDKEGQKFHVKLELLIDDVEQVDNTPVVIDKPAPVKAKKYKTKTKVSQQQKIF